LMDVSSFSPLYLTAVSV